jgi:hypothetical protein
MKKFFVMVLLVISITSFSFGSYVGFGQSNAQIAKTSHQIEKINRLVNPDLIYPHQGLFLPIPGLSYPIYYDVVHGDNLWFISKRVNNGEFTPTEQKIYPIIEKDNTPKGESFWVKYGDFIASNLLWLLLLLFVLAVIYKIAKWELSKPKNVDPTTAGTPQVPGGVPDAGAHDRILEIARGHYPSATLNLKNVRRGFLSGAANVHYANAKTKKINLKNIPSYAGEISVNGEVKTIYFLQPCGNDANRGDYMEGKDLVFNPSVFISENGNEFPLSTSEVTIDEKVTEEKAPQVAPKEEPKQVEVPIESEIFKISMAHTKLMTEMIEKNLVHSGTTETFLGDGCSVKTTFSIKNEALKQTKNEEKKG